MNGLDIKLSFCVVGTNGQEFLSACLDAIQAEIADLAGIGVASHQIEVLYLDNASTDQSVELASKHSVQPKVIALTRRAGKAANDTQLLQTANGEFALLLNEDSQLLPGAARLLLTALQSDADAGCAGAALLQPESGLQPSAWRFPGLYTTLLQALLLHKKHVVQSSSISGRAAPEPFRVDWCQSACLLVRRTAAERVNYLDQRFFVYGDEVDLQRRLSDAGWHSLHVPQAECIHHEQLSTGSGGDRRIVEFHRNHALYLSKHHGSLVELASRPLTALPYLVRAAAALILPGHSVHRYLQHVRASLLPRSGSGISESAAAFNAQLDRGELRHQRQLRPAPTGQSRQSSRSSRLCLRSAAQR